MPTIDTTTAPATPLDIDEMTAAFERTIREATPNMEPDEAHRAACAVTFGLLLFRNSLATNDPIVAERLALAASAFKPGARTFRTTNDLLAAWSMSDVLQHWTTLSLQLALLPRHSDAATRAFTAGQREIAAAAKPDPVDADELAGTLADAWLQLSRRRVHAREEDAGHSEPWRFQSYRQYVEELAFQLGQLIERAGTRLLRAIPAERRAEFSAVVTQACETAVYFMDRAHPLLDAKSVHSDWQEHNVALPDILTLSALAVVRAAARLALEWVPDVDQQTERYARAVAARTLHLIEDAVRSGSDPFAFRAPGVAARIISSRKARRRAFDYAMKTCGGTDAALAPLLSKQ
jgi:hypothetical protein